MASTRRGRRVILCMGSMRKECMARDWHTGEDSSVLRTSRKRGLFSLWGKRVVVRRGYEMSKGVRSE